MISVISFNRRPGARTLQKKSWRQNLSRVFLLLRTLGALRHTPVSPFRSWRRVRVAEEPVGGQDLRTRSQCCSSIIWLACTFESFFLVEVPFVFSLEEVTNMPGSFTEKLWSLFFLHPLCSRSSWLQVKCLLESKLWAKSSFSKKSANEEFRLCPSPKVEEFFLLLVEIGRLSLWMFALLSALSNTWSSSERRACASASSRHLSIFCQSANMPSCDTSNFYFVWYKGVRMLKDALCLSFTASIFSLTTFQFLNLTTVDQMWWKLSRRAKSVVSHFICASIDCKVLPQYFSKGFKVFQKQ